MLPKLLALLLALSAIAHAEPIADVTALNDALSKAKPGDVIVMKNGLYTSASILFPASGEAGKWVTLSAETPGRVTLTGHSQITLTGQYQHVTGLLFQRNEANTAVNFKGTRFGRLSHTGFNESGDPKSTYAHMIEIGEDSTDTQIDHCYLARSLSMSIGTRLGSVRSRLDHNWFRDITARGSNGQEAVQLQGYRLTPGTGAPILEGDHRLFATVEHNLFDGACGDEEIISVKSDNNVIRHNTFLKHPTANQGGLNIRFGKNNLVEANYFLGTAYGVRVSGESNRITNNYIEGVKYGLLLTAGGAEGWNYTAASHNLFANNTIADAKNAAVNIGVFYGLTKPDAPGKIVNLLPKGNRFYNNILMSSTPEQVITLNGEAAALSDQDFQANIVACSRKSNASRGELPKGPGLSPGDTTFLAKKEEYFVPADPKSVLGRGVSIEGLSQDITGNTRATTPAIGCDELSTSGGTGIRRPLTPQDVGPGWMHGDYLALEKTVALDELREWLRRYPDPKFRQQLLDVLQEGAR